ncbi:hypothetical protein QBC44DRAFT_207889, partial [Cladorrhinum sp. PSN332]
FYSPGLVCPNGWTTATVISRGMTDSIRAIEILRLMTADEIAEFCCPSGFTFRYADQSSAEWLANCESTMIEGNFRFWACNSEGYSLESTVTVGMTTTIVVTPSQTTASARRMARQYATATPPAPPVSTTVRAAATPTLSAVTSVLSRAVTRAPAIQLV